MKQVELHNKRRLWIYRTSSEVSIYIILLEIEIDSLQLREPRLCSCRGSALRAGLPIIRNSIPAMEKKCFCCSHRRSSLLFKGLRELVSRCPRGQRLRISGIKPPLFHTSSWCWTVLPLLFPCILKLKVNLSGWLPLFPLPEDSVFCSDVITNISRDITMKPIIKWHDAWRSE
jgi:hypothetical protein